MKKTTGIILGLILISAIGMLAYAYVQKPAIVEEYENPTPAPALSSTPGVGVTVTASSSL
jgi:hypothetical protein